MKESGTLRFLERGTCTAQRSTSTALEAQLVSMQTKVFVTVAAGLSTRDEALE